MIKGKAFGSVRDCVKFINNEGIPQSNIISIIPFEGIIFLIYNKND